MSDTILDPELGELPVILDTDTAEERAAKQKIIDDKIDAAFPEDPAETNY